MKNKLCFNRLYLPIVFFFLSIVMGFRIKDNLAAGWFATPVNGNTDFNSLFSGSFVDLTGIQSAGGAGLLASNVAGYDFRLLATSNAVDCGIGIEPFTGQTASVYGYTNTGATNLAALEISSNDNKIFDLQSIGITVDGLSTGLGARTVRMLGYRNGSAVSGALLALSVTPASNGGPLVIFNVAGDPDFVGIDKIRIESDGTYTIGGAIGADNINAMNFRSAVVPVNLLSFTATHDNGSVLLNWTTAQEINNSHIVIERSQDGNNFSEIGSVPAAQQNELINEYVFLDKRPLSGISYYRLLQVDLDGTKEYHPVRRVKIAITENIHVFPNPIVPGRASFTVEMERTGFQKMAYRLLNSNGLQVQTGYITQPVQQLFTSGLSEGFYLLCIGNRKPVKLEVRSRF
jgi:hypothetical protein